MIISFLSFGHDTSTTTSIQETFFNFPINSEASKRTRIYRKSRGHVLSVLNTVLYVRIQIQL